MSYSHLPPPIIVNKNFHIHWDPIQMPFLNKTKQNKKALLLIPKFFQTNNFSSFFLQVAHMEQLWSRGFYDSKNCVCPSFMMQVLYVCPSFLNRTFVRFTFCDVNCQLDKTFNYEKWFYKRNVALAAYIKKLEREKINDLVI